MIWGWGAWGSLGAGGAQDPDGVESVLGSTVSVGLVWGSEHGRTPAVSLAPMNSILRFAGAALTIFTLPLTFVMP